jgi:hypothetical protein
MVSYWHNHNELIGSLPTATMMKPMQLHRLTLGNVAAMLTKH